MAVFGKRSRSEIRDDHLARFERFATGIFDLGAVVYFVSVSALFLFFTTLSVEKRRWS